MYSGRLLHILLHYNEVLGREIGAGKRYELDLLMNQADLASLVGARREWVNRIVRDWSKRGLIEHRHGKITILELPAGEEGRNLRMDLSADDDGWRFLCRLYLKAPKASLPRSR